MANGEVPATTLLLDWRRGNADAGKELLARLQPQLRQIAAHYLRHERPGHILQPTAIVNELYIKLMQGHPVEWQNRAHFLAVASQQLRRILVDHAREQQAAKRGGGALATTLTLNAGSTKPLDDQILDLHHALDELGRLDARVAQVIELRYFGGLTEKEAAEVLSISVATLKRDWEIGRAWLVDHLRSEVSGQRAR